MRGKPYDQMIYGVTAAYVSRFLPFENQNSVVKRLDGFEAEEGAAIVQILRSQPRTRAGVLSDRTSRDDIFMNVNRATYERNAIDNQSGCLLVIVKPQGFTTSGGGLDDVATTVIDRAQIFRGALQDLAKARELGREFIRNIRNCALHQSDEDIFLFLSVLFEHSESLPPDLLSCTLGLLPDSELKNDANLQDRLMENRSASECLISVNHVSDGHLLSNLGQRQFDAEDFERRHLASYRRWKTQGSSDVKNLSQFLDYAKIKSGSIAVDFEFQPRLSIPPHKGFNQVPVVIGRIVQEDRDEVVEANKTESRSNIKWRIDSRCPAAGVKFCVTLRCYESAGEEYESAEEIAQMGTMPARQSGNSKAINWPRLIRKNEKLQRILAQQGAGGFAVFIRVDAIRGGQVVKSKNSDLFYLYSGNTENDGETAARLGGDPTTISHALYKITSERKQKPAIGKTRVEISGASLQAKFRYGESEHTANIDCPLSLWDRIRKHLEPKRDDFTAFKLDIDLERGEIKDLKERKMGPVPSLQEVSEYRQSRKKFLTYLFQTEHGVPEALMFNKDPINELANAYAKDFSGIWNKVKLSHPGEYPLGEQHRYASLLSADSLLVEDARRGLKALLLLPVHPTAVSWQQTLFELVQHWIEKDPTNLPPYDEIIESLRCGPRVLAYPVHQHESGEVMRFYYAGNLAALWPMYYPDGTVWSTDDVVALQSLSGISPGPIWEAKDSHKYLGRRLEHFARLHPYKDSLQAYCIDSSRGMEFLEAATSASKPQASLENTRISVSLAAPKKSRDFAQAIDKMVSYPGSREWSRYAEHLLGKSETILSPGFAYAKLTTNTPPGLTAQARCLLDTCTTQEGYDVCIIRSLLVPSVGQYSCTAGAVGSFRMYGLSLVPIVHFNRDRGARSVFAGDWSVGFEYDESPESIFTDKIRPQNTSVDQLVATTAAAWHLCSVAIGLGKNLIPGLRVSMLPIHEEALLAAHEAAEWVINQDPLFSIEFLDRQQTHLSRDGQPVLLDFAPESAPFPASQLIVSAKSSESLQRVAQQIAIDYLQRDIPVINGLSAISGRLLLQLSNPTPQVMGERAGLVVAHAHLRKKNHKAGFVIPLDSHREMFTQQIGGTGRMSDLLYVTCDDATIMIEAVEVKYTASDAVPAELVSGALEQAETTALYLESLFKNNSRLDIDYQYEKLAEILEFYRARAERHVMPTGIRENMLRNAIHQIAGTHSNLKISKGVVIVAPNAGPESWPDNIRGRARRDVTYLGRRELDELFGEEPPSEPGQSSPLSPRPDPASIPKGSVPSPFPLQPVPPIAPLTTEGASPIMPHNETVKPAKCEILLGAETESSLRVVWDPSALANGHFLLVGGSGAGKTTTLRHLLWQIAAQKVPTLVIDFHGDIEPYEFTEDLIELNDQVEAFHFNPFVVSKSCGAMRCRAEFVEALKAQNTNIGPQQGEVLTLAIDKTYEADAGKAIDFKDVCNTLSGMQLRKNQEGIRSSLEAYIRPYLESKLFHGGRPIDIERLVSGQCRLKISEVSEASRNALTDIVLRKVFLWAKLLGPVDPQAVGLAKYRLFIVLDEAQIFLKSNNNARACIAKYASEARKYGIGLVLATQLFDNVPQDVRGNIDAKLFMLCLDETEARKNARSAGLSKEDIIKLKKGQGYYLSSGYRYANRVQITPPWIAKKKN